MNVTDAKPTENSTAPVLPSWKTLLIPTNGVAFFAYLLFLFFICKPFLLLGDGATLRHVLTGEYVFQQHAIPDTNYVFALDPKATWLTHELLSDLILGGAQQWLGVNGVALVGAIAIALCLTWSFQFARYKGLGMVSGLLALIVAMLTMSLHWSARAHVFSYVPFLLMYFVLFTDLLSQRAKTISTIFIMALWANLHGSFVLGLFMIGLKAIGVLIDKSESIKRSLAIFIAAIVGACLNIRGGEFLLYVLSYAQNAHIHLHNAESHGLNFLTAGYPGIAFILLMILIVILWIWSKTVPKFAEFVFTIALFLGGIYSMRLIPYFSLIALPAMAPSWNALSLRYQNKKFFALEKKLDGQESKSPKDYWKIYALTLALMVGWLTLPFLKLTDYDPERLPVKAMDWLEKNPQSGLGFNLDNWGDYMYWRNNKPVFIDDKGDFYTDDFTEKYINVYTAQGPWKKTLDEYKLNWVILPNWLPLPALLSQDPAWHKVYGDETATIVARTKPITP
jgi:hypothetical protein